MPVSTTEPTARTARPRRSRTRSRIVSSLPALVLSTLKPHQYDLRPACASLTCPDCKTVVPITGLQTKRPKLVSHDTGRAGKAPAVRCRSSNRLVTVDVTVRKWQERLEDGSVEAAARRATAVRRKPKTPPTPPLSRVVPGPRTADDAHKVYVTHRRRCTACSKPRDQHGKLLKQALDKHGNLLACADGRRLGQIYVVLQWQDAARRRGSELEERLAQYAEHERARSLPVRRAAEVARYVPAVNRANEQRVRDELDATLLELQDHKTGRYRKLDHFERAALDARVGALFEVLRREAARA
ncbi:hypothetical protein OG422_31130 (plasmid) [Streptomyces sp. NBC_01525]|uniref:hypothetical protein n=1 Tax=Streptomyces sp. NBC_01525 TaxID=2903893 RepID=UPI002F91AA84